MKAKPSWGKRTVAAAIDTITVALVEDDAGIRENLARLINGAPGFRCVGVFATGEEALPRLPELQPAVVLVDINLPKMSGISLVAMLKAPRALAPVPHADRL